MNQKTSRWASSRPSHPIWGVAVLLLLALLATAGIKSYRDLAASRTHKADLEARIAATQESIKTLETRLENLNNDPHTLERIAREDLGLVRPEDVVIFLPESPAKPADETP